jgi:hypothetical protein
VPLFGKVRLHQSEPSFPEVFNISQIFSAVTNGDEHHLVTSGSPITFKLWQASKKKAGSSKEEIGQDEEREDVQRSNSLRSLPLQSREQTEVSSLVVNFPAKTWSQL